MLVARAPAAGRSVLGGTILPLGGSVYVDPEGEAVRTEVKFIRAASECARSHVKHPSQPVDGGTTSPPPVDK